MSYHIFLSNKAHKQYNSLDHHIQNKIKSTLFQLKEESHKGFSLSGGKYAGLRYVKINQKGV